VDIKLELEAAFDFLLAAKNLTLMNNFLLIQTQLFEQSQFQVLHLTSHLLGLTSYVLRLTSYVLRLTPHLSALTSHVSHLTYPRLKSHFNL
jgi:hypothetical protein